MMSEEKGKHLSFFSFLLEKKACQIFSRHLSQALPNKMNFFSESLYQLINENGQTENQPTKMALIKSEKKGKR